jgi:hypothetical protein
MKGERKRGGEHILTREHLLKGVLSLSIYPADYPNTHHFKKFVIN